MAWPSLSPATKKRRHDEMENEFTTDSDLTSGQEGKTPSELDAIIADYHHKVRTVGCRPLFAVERRRINTSRWKLLTLSR